MASLTSSALPPAAHPLPRGPIVALALWALAAFALSFSGLVSPERPAGVPLSILGCTAAVLLAWWRMPSVHAFFAGLDPRGYLAPHVLRAIVGAGFLVEYSRGMLPAEFALRAGVGDLIAGVLSALALCIPAQAPWRRKALWFVNAVGLVDILIVLVTAQRILFFGDPASMKTFNHAPWPMIPFFLVPVILSTHILLFWRLARRAPRPQA
ncbi:MAG TPA: hypothetical protein VF815_44165 [Myxococcaceae bacterium]|jgi:hypothetical protein